MTEPAQPPVMQGHQTLSFLPDPLPPPTPHGQMPTVPRNDALLSRSTALALPFPAELGMPPRSARTGCPGLASPHGTGNRDPGVPLPSGREGREAVPAAPLGTGTPRCLCLSAELCKATQLCCALTDVLG